MPDLSAVLDAIKKRKSAVAYAIITDSPRLHQIALDSQGDVPRLLAAVEAALKLADDWKSKAFALMEQLVAEDAQGTSAAIKGVGSSVHDNCSRDLRDAITRALTGGTDGT